MVFVSTSLPNKLYSTINTFYFIRTHIFYITVYKKLFFSMKHLFLLVLLYNEGIFT